MYQPSRRTRWLIWAVFTFLWTAALLFPTSSVLRLDDSETEVTRRMIVGKTLHVVAYAALAFLSGWVQSPPRYRWLLMFFLMAHPALTELGQSAVPGRSGQLTDVLLDQAGIAVGVALSWRWWVK
jgi:VanZ family protein